MENNDLISRSELVDEIEGYLLMCGSGSVGAVHDVLDAIREARAVEAEPVRHGRWEQSTNFVRCSECLVYWCVREKMSLIHIAKEDLKYCPNCGAKMDEED